MSNRLVSVIIVSAGNKDFLKNCLDSVRAQSHCDIEVIVMDNSAENLFYCEALNRGIRLAKGDFILCLNDDVTLEKDFIKNALRGFQVCPKVGSVSGKILRPDKKAIDSTGLFLSLWRTARERGYNRPDRGRFQKEGFIFGVTGAVAFYKGEMLEDIKMDFGYFDPSYRMFYEDLDVAWRAKKRGWKAYYAPGAIAYHVRGGTARANAPGAAGKRFARIYLNDELKGYLARNRYRTIMRNESAVGFLLHLPFILLYDLAVFVATVFVGAGLPAQGRYRM